jgi:hypothetical protein
VSSGKINIMESSEFIIDKKLAEAERFIALIQREKFDYTQWRQNLFTELSGEEISRQAMAFQQRKQKAANG